MRQLLIILAFIPSALLAQQAEPVIFPEKIHDFGEISETAGHVEYDFTFTNNSGRPMKILQVQPSCGCTTSGWTKDLIPAGGSGFVKASFDPKGRPGYFNKSLTVTTDADALPIVLQIKGQVGSKSQMASGAEYPVERGNLRLKVNSFNLDKVFVNLPPVAKEFAVFNAGSKTIQLIGIVNGPAYIKGEMPKQLAPNERGTIRLTYDGKMRGKFGFMSDNIEIGTDDEHTPTKSFSVYATLEEFFPALTPEEAAKAPVFRIDVPVIEFGKIQNGNTVVREVNLRNLGKKDLIIRAIQENCTCVQATIESMKIKPGSQTKVKVAFNTTDRSGTQQKAVTFYTTDPKNPVQRITLTAYVN